jgi:hypothetical protein
MNTHLDSDISSSSAWLVIAVKDGKIVVNVNLPLRFTFVVIGALAAVGGYPAVADVITKLLHTG